MISRAASSCALRSPRSSHTGVNGENVRSTGNEYTRSSNLKREVQGPHVSGAAILFSTAVPLHVGTGGREAQSMQFTPQRDLRGIPAKYSQSGRSDLRPDYSSMSPDSPVSDFVRVGTFRTCGAEGERASTSTFDERSDTNIRSLGQTSVTSLTVSPMSPTFLRDDPSEVSRPLSHSLLCISPRPSKANQKLVSVLVTTACTLCLNPHFSTGEAHSCST